MVASGGDHRQRVGQRTAPVAPVRDHPHTRTCECGCEPRVGQLVGLKARLRATRRAPRAGPRGGWSTPGCWWRGGGVSHLRYGFCAVQEPGLGHPVSVPSTSTSSPEAAISDSQTGNVSGVSRVPSACAMPMAASRGIRSWNPWCARPVEMPTAAAARANVVPSRRSSVAISSRHSGIRGRPRLGGWSVTHPGAIWSWRNTTRLRSSACRA